MTCVWYYYGEEFFRVPDQGDPVGLKLTPRLGLELREWQPRPLIVVEERRDTVAQGRRCANRSLKQPLLKVCHLRIRARYGHEQLEILGGTPPQRRVSHIRRTDQASVICGKEFGLQIVPEV